MWARLDDAILDNPKIIAAGPLGFALHVAAITWCARNLTDGFIPKRRVTQLLDLGSLRVSEATLGRIRHALTTADVAEDLARIGLWHDHGTSWELHDYLVYNPSKAEVVALREATRIRVERHRKRRGCNAPCNGVTNASVTHHPVPVPVPGSEKNREKRSRSLRSLDVNAAEADPQFLRFWDAYPRRVGKQDACKAWATLTAPPVETILAALDWQRLQPRWLEEQGRFIPHPATYLNHRRWEDEPPLTLFPGTTSRTAGNLAAIQAGLELVRHDRR